MMVELVIVVIIIVVTAILSALLILMIFTNYLNAVSACMHKLKCYLQFNFNSNKLIICQHMLRMLQKNYKKYSMSCDVNVYLS